MCNLFREMANYTLKSKIIRQNAGAVRRDFLKYNCDKSLGAITGLAPLPVDLVVHHSITKVAGYYENTKENCDNSLGALEDS